MDRTSLKAAVSPNDDEDVDADEDEEEEDDDDASDGTEVDADSLTVENQNLRDKLKKSREENHRLKKASTAEAKAKKAAGEERYWSTRTMKNLSVPNQAAVHKFVKTTILPKCKFLPDLWYVFSLEKKTSMSYLVLKREVRDDKGRKLGRPLLVQTADDGRSMKEWWYQDVAKAIRYKRTQLLNFSLTKMGKKYLCKCSMSIWHETFVRVSNFLHAVLDEQISLVWACPSEQARTGSFCWTRVSQRFLPG